MSTTTCDITVSTDEPTIEVSRFFKAPPELVFAAWTDPQHLPNWWGPARLQMVECQIDLRVGGGWRMVQRAPDGMEFGFHGTYREIDAPHRLVATFVYEGMPDDEAVGTTTFAAVDGGTMMVDVTRHPSMAARDQHIANGMESGMTESLQRLDEVLASHPA
jgi:uncharacterized protein YndB with AHSA1/START domain